MLVDASLSAINKIILNENFINFWKSTTKSHFPKKSKNESKKGKKKKKKKKLY